MSTPDASGTAGVRFRIDPDRAESVIAALEDAAARVQTLIDRVQGLTRVTPAGADAVSQYAAKRMSEWAGGDSALLPALNAYLQRLQDAAEGYRQQLNAYVRSDALNASAQRRLD